MKAVSPMIATVLLIVFTVAVAGLLIAWYPSFFQTQSGTVESQLNKLLAAQVDFLI
jgi:flagellin-like protein